MVAMEAILGKDARNNCLGLWLALASIGVVTTVYYSFSLLSLFYRIFIPGMSIQEFRKGDRPAYAIITGPTSGIGKSFAFSLAKKGFNLILVSRSLQKLQAIKSEISEKVPNIDIVICDVDMASAPLDSKFESTVREVAEKKGDIRVLVNNAGRSHDIPVTFEETSVEEMEGIIGLNIGGVVRATKIVLPFMLNDKKKKWIVNVGSFAAYSPTPLLATYTGTKAFLSAWSLATKHELAPKNIIVQHLNAYLVTSKLSKIRRSSLFIPTEDAFVRGVMHNIGRDGSPYWTHAIAEWMLEHATVLVGGRLGSIVVGINKKNHEDIRRRALRKLQKAR